MLFPTIKIFSECFSGSGLKGTKKIDRLEPVMGSETETKTKNRKKMPLTKTTTETETLWELKPKPKPKHFWNRNQKQTRNNLKTQTNIRFTPYHGLERKNIKIVNAHFCHL